MGVKLGTPLYRKERRMKLLGKWTLIEEGKLDGDGENCTLRGFSNCTNWSDQIKTDVMNGTRSMHRIEQKCILYLYRKSHVRSRH